MKKNLRIILTLVLALAVLVTYGSELVQSSPAEAPTNNSPMKYVSVADLKSDMESDAPAYLILDVRKAEDYALGHIKGAVIADMDKARGGDDASGFANMRAALLSATGSETGKENTQIAIVCYSGKAYAQKGTDILVSMGVNADNIYTLEGGMNAWNGAGADYTALVTKD